MSIKYTDISSIALNEKDDVSLININKALVRLLSNDLQLTFDTAYSPQIWERKWINDDTISGYPRGYCVWYNVETIDEFAYDNKNSLLRYVAKNPQLNEIYNSYTAETDKQRFIKNILSGYVDTKTNTAYESIYELGDISDPPVILISLKDNNKDTPDTLSSWKKFILSDKTNSELNSLLSSFSNELLSTHMQNAHFNDVLDESFLENYMKKDMSNISNLQKFSSHEYQVSSTGFDYVTLFVQQPITTSKYINCIIKDRYTQKTWTLKDIDQLVVDGKFSVAGASLAKSKLSKCANYESDNIALVVDNLVDTTSCIVDITYTAKSVNAVPSTTTDYNIIANRLSAYNATFEILPINTQLSTTISSYIDKYAEVDTPISTFYDSVSYTYNKWFRQWNSGYLEHGGTIVANKDALSVKVNFNWDYNDNSVKKTAPIYDYPKSNFSFYGYHTNIDSTYKIAYDSHENLKYNNRYVVNITPIANDFSTDLSGNSSTYPEKRNMYKNYINNEVTQMTNDSFVVVFEPQTTARIFSYYVSGYRSNYV